MYKNKSKNASTKNCFVYGIWSINRSYAYRLAKHTEYFKYICTNKGIFCMYHYSLLVAKPVNFPGIFGLSSSSIASSLLLHLISLVCYVWTQYFGDYSSYSQIVILWISMKILPAFVTGWWHDTTWQENWQKEDDDEQYNDGIRNYVYYTKIIIMSTYISCKYTI